MAYAYLSRSSYMGMGRGRSQYPSWAHGRGRGRGPWSPVPMRRPRGLRYVSRTPSPATSPKQSPTTSPTGHYPVSPRRGSHPSPRVSPKHPRPRRGSSPNPVGSASLPSLPSSHTNNLLTPSSHSPAGSPVEHHDRTITDLTFVFGKNGSAPHKAGDHSRDASPKVSPGASPKSSPKKSHAKTNGSEEQANAHVVIVGGGYAGIAIARKLQGKINFTLIDPKEYFHHHIGALRSAVRTDFAKKTFIPYDATFGKRFKQGRVKDVNTSDRTIILETGETMSYTHLVLATGCTGPFPGRVDDTITAEEAISRYNNLAEQIETADKIVIVGGGVVGIELTGEILSAHKNKNVTVIHAHQHLINDDVLPGMRTKLQEKLARYGVTFILDERVKNLEEVATSVSKPTTVKTDAGTEVSADLVIRCTGVKPNTAVFANNLGGKLDDSGRIKVNELFEVTGLEHVYAIGGCNDVAEVKMPRHSTAQGELLADNIGRKLDHKEMKPHTQGQLMMEISLGPNSGVSQVKGLILGSFLTKYRKSKDLFVHRFWKKVMKQEVPH
ncbi:Apoptosis-inducing factor 2 [Branchiostoma belcheri]|nr:Apoptosis-inducing factor 2 [Branchiostoma belcheri]